MEREQTPEPRWRVPSSVGRWTKQAAPFLLWVYLGVALYVVAGSFTYPVWWKRFLFHGGVWDSRLWANAFTYLWQLVLATPPIAAVLVVLVIASIGRVVFLCGKEGPIRAIRRFGPPRRGVSALMTFLLVGALLGLTRVKGDFRTQDEWNAFFAAQEVHLAEVMDSEWWQTYQPPAAGVYLYLHPLRVAGAYSALQPEFAVSGRTEKRGTDSSASGGLSLAPVDLHVSGKATRESTVVTSAQPFSPQRAATWLVQHFRSDDQTLKLLPESIPDSWQLRSAKETLGKFGVKLTSSQLGRLKAEANARLLRMLEFPEQNVPVLYKGTLLLKATTTGVRLEFGSEGELSVDAAGTCEPENLEHDVLDCARAVPGGCRIPSKQLLALVWRHSGSGNRTQLDVLPLAIW
jgi:hypothetical protein